MFNRLVSTFFLLFSIETVSLARSLEIETWDDEECLSSYRITDKLLENSPGVSKLIIRFDPEVTDDSSVKCLLKTRLLVPSGLTIRPSAASVTFNQVQEHDFVSLYLNFSYLVNTVRRYKLIRFDASESVSLATPNMPIEMTSCHFEDRVVALQSFLSVESFSIDQQDRNQSPVPDEIVWTIETKKCI